ncbi:hypothetical protein BJX96DRAFT_157855 [Aspergillus floccosus]
MESSNRTPNQTPQSDTPQSTASRYGSDFLAAWKDSQSSDNPAMPTNNQYPAHKERTGVSDICHCAQCQPVLDRLVGYSNPRKAFSQLQNQLQQQSLNTAQTTDYYHNRNYGYSQSVNTRRINEAYHNRRQPTETPPMRQRERATGPPRSETGLVEASSENMIPAQSYNVDLQNMYYHQRPMDSDSRTQ